MYVVDLPINHSLWCALGVTQTFLVHLIPEFGEQGCTNTLCFHGFSHMWFGDRLPIQFGDEAGEAYLHMAERFAPVTSTKPTASIEDGWRHELYTKFCKAKTKGRGVTFWRPVWGPIVFEQCVLGGNALWQKNFLRLVDTLVQVHDCTLLMHSATQSVRLGYTGAAEDATHVYCICGQCGSMRSGPHEWVRFALSAVSSWPTLGVQSLHVYRPRWRSRGCLNFGTAAAANTAYLDNTTFARTVVPQCHTAITGTTTITIADATTTTVVAATCTATGRRPRVRCLNNGHAPKLGSPRRLDTGRRISHLRLERSIGV